MYNFALIQLIWVSRECPHDTLLILLHFDVNMSLSQLSLLLLKKCQICYSEDISNLFLKVEFILTQ